MGRRIFEEKNFNLNGKVLPFDDFKLFIDKPQGFKINEEHYPKIIAKAESWLAKEIPICYASEYMMFKRDGNRSIYEDKFFPRRDALLSLATAEYVERKGRFTGAGGYGGTGSEAGSGQAEGAAGCAGGD